MAVTSRKRLRKIAQKNAAKRYRDKLASDGYVNKRVNITPDEVPLWDDFMERLKASRNDRNGNQF